MKNTSKGQRIRRFMRSLALYLPLLAFLAFAGMVQAQGLVDPSADVAAQAHIGLNILLIIGTLGSIACIVFGAFKLAGRDYMEGIISLVAAFAIGWGVGKATNWGETLTGVSLG